MWWASNKRVCEGALSTQSWEYSRLFPPRSLEWKTQPLDVDLYGPFKYNSNTEVKRAAQIFKSETFGLFDLLYMIKRAY